MCASLPRSRTSRRTGVDPLLDDRLRNCIVQVVLQRPAGRLHEHDNHHLLLQFRRISADSRAETETDDGPPQIASRDVILPSPYDSA
jgi:hypothetical protein